MDLSLLFSSIDDRVTSQVTGNNTVYQSIDVYQHKMPNFKEADVALIGIDDYRGTAQPDVAQPAADLVRKKLYALKKGFGRYRIVDLGNLRHGVTITDTYERLREACKLLLSHNVLPVIIGGGHDLGFAQYQAYEALNKLISVLTIDAFLDMEEGGETPANRSHIQQLLVHEPNYLFNYVHLAYQSYLIDARLTEVIEKLYFEAYRLGQLREQLRDMEPVIRDADMMTFDVSAIKSSDAPGSTNPQPFGLTGEEACQLCWYAGQNEKLTSVGFYEYNPDEDDHHGKTAAVIATMVWYFIEGFYHRRNELDFATNDYLRYLVSMPVEPETLVFYKSKLSEKWWMEVPGQPQASQPAYHRTRIVPCSYADYQTATEGNIPERWIMAQSRLA